MGFEYVAVPWPPDAPEPQSELRPPLEELGFRMLGGCALHPRHHPAVERTAASYGERAAEFEEWATRPSQIYAAPDLSAFAQLAWLWDCRYACLTTVLRDGRVIQTLHAWGTDPVWPGPLAMARHWTNRETEQLAMATDRDATIVDGVRDAWDEHRRRVTGAGGEVSRHDRLEDYAALWAAESATRSRWSRRTQWLAFALALVAVATALTLVNATAGPQPWWVRVLVNLVAIAVGIVVYVRLWLWVRRWRWPRPRFRAPVAGSEA